MKPGDTLYSDASWAIRVYSASSEQVLVDFVRRGPSGAKTLDRIGVWEHRRYCWVMPPTRPWWPASPQVPAAVREAVERKLREVGA